MSFAAMPALMLAVAAGAPERYADVLEAYRAGAATAVERVGQVPEKAIRDEIRRVQRLRWRALSVACLDCSEKRLFAAYPVAAAAVLHTARGLREDRAGRGAEGILHFGFARDWLSMGEPELDPLFVEWYAALATHLFHRVELDTAERTLKDATRQFPEAARLWLAYGVAAEMRAHLTAEPDHVFSSDRQYRDERRQFEADRQAACRDAEARYRRALDLDPALVEARLRLGQVLARQDRMEDALRELDQAAASTDDPRALYLAHLLAGRAEERRERPGAALLRYREATAALESGEAGWVALAHALARAGDRDGAAAAIARVVQGDPGPGLDPYRAYHHGGRGDDVDPLRAPEAWIR